MKVFAAICMLIDHIGMVFFPDQMIWRVIGRLAMPIFAYCVGRGILWTSSKKRYYFRLGGFALISQIPFWLLLNAAGESGFLHLNIGFTFLFAALCIEALERVYQNEKNTMGQKIVFALAFIIGLLLADKLNADYGSYGILTVILCYWIIKEKRPVWQLIIGSLMLTGVLFAKQPTGFYLQAFSTLGFLVCWLLRDVSERKLGKFFYVFYPLHMVLIWVVYRWC